MSVTPPSQRVAHRPQLRIAQRRLLLVLGDLLAVALSVLTALVIWSVVAPEPPSLEFIRARSHWFLVFMIAWVLFADANDFYDLRIVLDRRAALWRLLAINLQVLVLYLLFFFFSQPLALPRLFVLYYAAASFIWIALWRLFYLRLSGWLGVRRRVLIVGTDLSAIAIIGAIGRHAFTLYDVCGVIAEPDDILKDVCDVPVVGTGSDLAMLVREEQVSELIVSSTRELSRETFRGVMDAYEQGAAITPMPLLYERITGQVPVDHLLKDWSVMLPLDTSAHVSLYSPLKRLIDILLGLLGAVIFVFLLPFLVLLIRLDSPGSIFYGQDRVGLNGRVFRLYKFRSMRSDAEAQTGAVFSHRGDSRVTRVGRLLRKSRLDELPQVWNVLRGEMSVVGPRPERPEHIERLVTKIPFYRTRHVIRPGLTGWAQVRYSYGSTDEDALIKLQYDLYYMRHQSLLLDISIIIRTVGKVLKMAGV